jgi:flagellar assembly protein FliH
MKLQIGRSTRIEAFRYPASTTPSQMLWEDIPEVGSEAPLSETPDCGDEETNLHSESCEASPTSVAEQATRSFEAGREQGIRDARESAANEQRALVQAADKMRVEQATNLAGQVKTDQERFLQEAENELVHLALAIAARILRREAQMDPLFLIGAVRVALGQLAATVQVRLCVPAAESGLWTETLAHVPNLRVKPTVVPESSMQLGDCLIETEMGSADLGLRAQLQQMELALLDASPAIRADMVADLCPDDQIPEEQEVPA